MMTRWVSLALLGPALTLFWAACDPPWDPREAPPALTDAPAHDAIPLTETSTPEPPPQTLAPTPEPATAIPQRGPTFWLTWQNTGTDSDVAFMVRPHTDAPFPSPPWPMAAVDPGSPQQSPILVYEGYWDLAYAWSLRSERICGELPNVHITQDYVWQVSVRC
jgi:hypothetical protein